MRGIRTTCFLLLAAMLPGQAQIANASLTPDDGVFNIARFGAVGDGATAALKIREYLEKQA